MFQAHVDGDAAAFEALVQRSWPEAYRIARHCLKDADAAEDVAQEVFLQVARQRPELERPGSFGRWFRTLVYNAVRMHARGRTRRQAREAGGRMSSVPFGGVKFMEIRPEGRGYEGAREQE